VPNPIDRYTVSQRNKLKANADGSDDLFVRNESPGKAKEQNWLPAPKGQFILMMRLNEPATVERCLGHSQTVCFSRVTINRDLSLRTMRDCWRKRGRG
jgi:hypothetical protein